jgi:regulator of sigma E protease
VGLCLMPLLALISLKFLGSIAMAAVGLGFVIFVHELGHFLVAKLFGVKCEKFYVGFDVPIRIGPLQLPRTLFKKQWGETEYGIGIIPLGGYVKMLGQDDNPANTAKEAERIRVAREQNAEGDTSEPRFQVDPRSYPAKTVPQRFAIISAGVIMNLIFAVIFGMVAYRMGVSYTPTVVGSTSPGLSAWDVGLQTGDRILQMGRDGQPSEHLRFDKDMMVKVLMTGANQDLDLLVRRYSPPDTAPADPEWITVRLSSPQAELHGRPIIGIGQAGTNTVATNAEIREILGHLPANRTEPALERGDRIVAVDGVPVQDYRQVTAELAARVDQDCVLEVERPAGQGDSSTSAAPQLLQVTLPANPVRWLGLQLAMGPITAVQRDSVGEQAGFQVGDRLLSLNGQPIHNPLELPEIVRRHAGQPIELQVQRAGSDQPVTVAVTPVAPTMLHVGVGPQRPVAIEALGIAYTVENTVDDVVPGSAAAAAGLRSGDLLQTAEFVAATPETAEREKKIFGPPEPMRLGEDKLDWPRVHNRIQLSLPDTRVRLTYQRGDRLHTVELQPQLAEGWFYADRGLKLTTMEEVHQVEAWATALGLGWRETVESMRQVYFILSRLVTGQLSPMNLGGPASIATMAGLEASESMARLLVFLTLLSANLAVINFLPIPVLDGGHAMFLLYEGIFRKPVNERVAFGLTMVGFCFVLGLMLFVIGLDVWRLSGLAG